MIRIAAGLSILWLVGFGGLALPADEPRARVEAVVEGDLSTFPKIEGKVVQVLGNLNSFVPPRVGAEVHWDLKSITQLTQLPFGPGPENQERDYYIPLGANREGVNPLRVETITTFTTGAFRTMRLVSLSETQRSPGVTVDIIAGGKVNFVKIWVVVESEVTLGVVLIEGKADGPFPEKIAEVKKNQTLFQDRDPIKAALVYLREQKTDLSGHDVEKAAASRYCPPQSTVYEWCVSIPARGDSGAEALWIALPAKGTPWRLNPKTLKRIR